VPAVQRPEGVELAAVATSRQEMAAAAATAFGAHKAYGTATDLFRDPDIDPVAVCVKVPKHRADAYSPGRDGVLGRPAIGRTAPVNNMSRDDALMKASPATLRA
jgi:hypothetical protein